MVTWDRVYVQGICSECNEPVAFEIEQGQSSRTMKNLLWKMIEKMEYDSRPEGWHHAKDRP